MKILKRVVGDVVVLDAHGHLMLGEGTGVLEDTVRQLVNEGTRKILLNLGDVPRIDSSGCGELWFATTLARNRGASLKVLHLTKHVHDIFQSTKFYSLYEVFDDELVALRSFGFSLHCQCPSCGSLCGPPWVSATRPIWDEQTCSRCDARFTVETKEQIVQKGRRKHRHYTTTIDNLRVPTYEKEYFQVSSGPPYTVQTVGRLNLFTSSAFDNVWRAIPSPRRVIFDLSPATDIDAPGWQALLMFLEKKELIARAVISLENVNEALTAGLLPAKDVYLHRKAALAALGDISDTPPWLGEFVTENG